MTSYRPTSPVLSPTGYRAQSPDSHALTSKYNDNPYQSSRITTHYASPAASPFASPPSYAPPEYKKQSIQSLIDPPQPVYATQDMPAQRMKQEDAMTDVNAEPADPTMGVVLKTSFPVARIKRIMQKDDEIGKVAQVTPHVVSRALELFMIKLIVASSEQARGPGGASSKGPRRVLSQHMKKAVQELEEFDFLIDLVKKVPDAPAKSAKKESSDSEGPAPKPKKRSKKKAEPDD